MPGVGKTGAARGAALAFTRAVRALDEAAPRFDDAGHAAKQAALDRAATLPLVECEALLRWHERLLFLAAHPSDERMRRAVEREFARLAAFLKPRSGKLGDAFHNQGLPWVDTVTRFSHDCVRRLLAEPGLRIALQGFGEPTLDLAEVLRLTLPSLERGETTAGHEPLALLDALGLRTADRLRFIVEQLARFDADPYTKDLLFDRLDLFVRVSPGSRALSKAGNRLPRVQPPFHQRELLRRFDPPALMNQALPPPRELGDAALADVVRVLQRTMLLTARETDPATYLDPNSLRLFDLERGIAVAIFGMTPDRQLPLESYVGFTLFKNGLPAAYGGAWLLGPRANFGMNIFEPYRGGESGYMMCQVLRVYRQAFGARAFEVDAHQFGLDNPDGITSGAYWFYWRHGFRSLDPALARRAERERRRMAADPSHRSSEKTLLAFTGSNVMLQFEPRLGPTLAELTEGVTRWITRRWKGQRAAAERDAVTRFVERQPLDRLDADRRRVLGEVALLAAAFGIDDDERLDLLARMVTVKPVDAFAYQQLLLAFFDRWPVPRGRPQK